MLNVGGQPDASCALIFHARYEADLQGRHENGSSSYSCVQLDSVIPQADYRRRRIGHNPLQFNLCRIRSSGRHAHGNPANNTYIGGSQVMKTLLLPPPGNRISCVEAHMAGHYKYDRTTPLQTCATVEIRFTRSQGRLEQENSGEA